MPKTIEPKLRKIGDYLKLESNANFVIPGYQRAYSWENKHCDKLWQDITNFIESNGDDPYFFGTIIISCENNDTKLNLIDGQQRTTTFILLLKALLIKICDCIENTKNDSDSENLEKALERKRDSIIAILYKASDEELYAILKNFDNVKNRSNILENNSINELYKDELSKILESNDFESAEESVEKIPYKQKDNKFTNYFRNFKFFYEKFLELSDSEINKFTDYILNKSEIIEIRSWNVDQAITMFNSLNSDGMSLLDADIISAKLYSNAKEEREKFNTKWQELKSLVSLLQRGNVANIDSILMQYMYIKRSLDKEYISQNNKVDVTTPGLRRYYIEQKQDLLNNPLCLVAQLLKISKIWHEIKDYSIIKVCFKFNENIKLYLISYLFKFEIDELSENLVEDFLNELLKIFAILEVVETGYSSSKFKTFLFGLNIKLVDKNIELCEIKNDINEHINKQWKMDEIKEYLIYYTKNPLIYLNEYIFCLKNNKKFILPEKYEIEHIMPRSGKNIAQIQSDANINDENEFLCVVNKLGNKILLEENINRSIGNAWFRTKVENSIKDKRGYKDSVFNVALSIVDKYKNIHKIYWNIEDINNRTENISEEIVKFIFN